MERERLKPGTYKFWTYIFISIGKVYNLRFDLN